MSDTVDVAKKILFDEGFVVLRKKSHETTLRELDRARNQLEWEKSSAEHARQWAIKCLDEERRLTHRLNAVCTAAAALGVSITAINQALDAATTKDN